MAKRFFDIIIVISTCVVTLPLLLILYLLVRVLIGTPAFFIQERAGLHGRPFKIVKFRTMNNKTDEDGNMLPDNLRLTRFGRFLRSTSLDELPEMWNVIKGEMSIVGPRPLFMEYLALYTEEQLRRHDVLPGITGWAQINGRNAISWEERFKLDVWYVDNHSLWIDLKIILLTVIKVLKREGISAKGEVTMPKFRGSLK